MKRIIRVALPLAIAGVVTGCNSSREIQADFVTAQLIKVDTIYRYQSNEKQLTWRCQNNVEFVSFVPVSSVYKVGSRFHVLLPR